MSTMKFLVAALVVLAVAAGTCKNPLFTKSIFSAVDAVAPKLRLTPVVQKSKLFCPHLQGKLSCCAPSTLQSMSVAYNKYEKSISAKVDLYVNSAITHCDTLDKLEKNVALENRRVKAIELIGTTAAKCRSAALEYARAMMCAGCAASAASFVTKDNKFRVASSEVAKLQNSCNSFGSAVNAFGRILKSQITHFRSAGHKINNINIAPLAKANVATSIFFDVATLFSNKQATTPVVAVSKLGFKPLRMLRQAASANASASSNSSLGNITSTIKGKLANATSAIENYFKGAAGLKVLLIPAAIVAFLLN